MSLKAIGSGVGYLKMGMFGEEGSGKTYTASRVAVGLRKLLGLKGPVAAYDTEAAFRYIKPWIERETGLDLLGNESRSFDDAVQFVKDCVAEGVSVAIIDSASHIWKELNDSYLAQRNEQRLARGRSATTRLEFQDFNVLKGKWAIFSDLFLTSKLHLIVCGRAQFTYDYEQREDGSGKDLIKTGVRMKSESSFGYESSLLVEMKRVPLEERGKATAQFTHRCTVLKDRFGVLDGQQMDNPTFEFFEPYMKMLVPGSHATVNLDAKTNLGVNEDGDAEWAHERRRRTIACENLQGLLLREWPGMGAQEKLARQEVVWKLLETRAWTEVETTNADRLEAAIAAFPAAVVEVKSELAKRAADEADAEAKAKAEKKAKPAKAEEVKA